MCGIAGIINKTPRTFDYSTFCTLGIVNDSRGGDSCGVFIDGKYEYGVDKRKFFSTYFPNSDLLYDIKKSSIALLHCRKASIGTISKETAQPVILTNDKGKVEFVLLHNGTIHNYQNLAEKYIPNVDITGMTDSQVMARIFYYKGYECLNEYNGGAVFAIVDYRNKEPEVLLYKGASKRITYSKEAEEERPLFYCIDKVKNELVFSSIGVYLLALRKNLKVFSLNSNILCKFTGTSLVVIKEYKRENCIQNKETIYYYDKWDDYIKPYISVNLAQNIYNSKGVALHERVYLTNYGSIENVATKNNLEIWFFNGIALKNVHCFRFLTSIWTDSKLPIGDFINKFQIVIRFLSMDQLFSDKDIWYKAISPTKYVKFTGVFQPICTVSKTEYVNGSMVMRTYNGSYNYTKELVAASIKGDINFKEIREQCESLMK